MISGIPKKVIFLSFLFINFLQPSKSAELSKIDKNANNRNLKLTLASLSNVETSSTFYKNIQSDDYPDDVHVNFLNKKNESLFVVKAENQHELIIQSDKQSEINDVLYAEGNVYVSYRGKLLKADNLIYDKLNKKIKANGNITFILGDQILREFHNLNTVLLVKKVFY